jgi:uncharacterized protein (DUF305 family)
MSRRALLCALASGTAAVTLAGCGASAAKPAPAPALSAGQAGFFGGTDLAWVEINIAMNEQLQPLLALAQEKASRAAVKSYAAQVQSFSQQELTGLRALHDQAQLPSENPHEGMPMPGMVTPAQVSEAKAASGAAFDKLLLQRLKEHFDQGTSLANSEEKAGVEPQTLALAKQVLTNRADALKQLTALNAA